MFALTLGVCSVALAADGVWIELPGYPSPISNNAVASVTAADGTAIYSFMGIVDPTDTSTITPSAYKLVWQRGADGRDAAAPTWERIADVPNLRRRPRIAANAVTVAGRVYLLGGYIVRGSGELTDFRLFRYEPDGDTYTRLADVPTEVDDTVASVYLERYIALVSGWHGPASDNVRNVQVYDTLTDTWAQATPIPGPQSGLFGHVGGIVGDRLVYMDGVTSGAGFQISRRAWVGLIDPNGAGDVTTIAWQRITRHPGEPTYRAAGGTKETRDGRLLVVGGTDNPYNINGTGYDGRPSQPLDQIFTFDPNGSAWRMLTAAGVHVPTMDHRGLVPVGRGWVTVGGMIAPGVATDRVYMFTRNAERFPGDVDYDLDVDLGDLAIVLAAFGKSSGTDGYDPRADLDGDESITAADLQLVLSRFGERE